MTQLKREETETELVAKETDQAEQDLQKAVKEPAAPPEAPASPEPAAVAEESAAAEPVHTFRTKLGQRVAAGEYKSLNDLLAAGEMILETGIVDLLEPHMKSEIIFIGGSPGKGGGSRRTATKRTARMHKSGRRFKLTAMIVIGNENGVLGMAKASSREHRLAMEKAEREVKKHLVLVKRGCGSWECNCGGTHSIPYAASGKAGSVKVFLLPAPRGVGIVANDPAKKVIRLAGIKDIWVQTRGKTATRNNLVEAVYEAIRNLSRTKGGL